MVRAPISDLARGERRIEGAVAHYLSRVLRLRAGDSFVAFDPVTAREADAVMVWAEHDAVSVRFGPLREGATRASRDVYFIQGLAKADKCDAVVRDATELGATRIRVAATMRSVVKLDRARAVDRQSRWARVAQQAARQCGRSDVPRVDPPCSWQEALADVPEGTARFCLWEEATEPLAARLLEALSQGTAIAFACGPEGGLEVREVEWAAARGWRPTSLGRFRLRTETVAAAVLGAVRVWEGLT
jgi:16S rRNA (uracil1498-N3)-methyltransferase